MRHEEWSSRNNSTGIYLTACFGLSANDGVGCLAVTVA
jgi:hypothetical protein